MRADFPADPASASRARRFVDVTLRSWSCEPLLDIAMLLVSELVSNAVLHAGTAIQVVIRSDGDLVRVEVHDGNARSPIRKHYSSLATTGRGLLLVERMASDWGVDHDDDGKSVWFELDSSSGGEVSAATFQVHLDDLADDLDGGLDDDVAADLADLGGFGRGRRGAGAGDVGRRGPGRRDETRRSPQARASVR